MKTDAWARFHAVLAGVTMLALGAPSAVLAGEGGTSHILPGANATLIDVLPISPGWFVKPMYLNYGGSASAQIPTAAGAARNAAGRNHRHCRREPQLDIARRNLRRWLESERENP